MKLYLQVTRDKYELPLAIADSPAELARITGAKPATVASTLSHYRHGRYTRTQFVEVEIDEEAI